MTRKEFTRYTCDVLQCQASRDVAHSNGYLEAPLGWGFITIAQLRGHSNVSMWLCEEHFKTIDDWNYS